MKEQFRTNRIRPERRSMIDAVNGILQTYHSQGYRLTLRQLYYQLVAQGMVPNSIKEYSKLSQTCVIGRMNGLIDWDMIEDRVRIPYLEYYSNSPQEAIEDTLRQYKRDRQEGQPKHIEIWTEKDAVSNILKRVSKKFHVRLMINRGYSSCSAMYQTYNRFYAADKEQVILYVGDHDPSGLDMLRDIQERLYEFGAYAFKLIPVALTMSQINQFKPPPNPTKISDPRAKWYINQFGNTSWELDALSPKTLETLIKVAVISCLDTPQYNSIVKQENKDKIKLENIIKQLKRGLL